eukprot:TRINITY_DN95268_c0_g1_i1.p3 TRINITY_DN95268_c0_g1~~TRINITY_DN95268_c0_g1_i1.p3  ORF type:complete len:135 (+),score=4.32 TRINITY_DN95268_c0_g1_i1:1-405(+)
MLEEAPKRLVSLLANATILLQPADKPLRVFFEHWYVVRARFRPVWISVDRCQLAPTNQSSVLEYEEMRWVRDRRSSISWMSPDLPQRSESPNQNVGHFRARCFQHLGRVQGRGRHCHWGSRSHLPPPMVSNIPG